MNSTTTPIILAGLFPLLSGIVGGIIGVLGTYLTLRSTSRLEEAKRIFERRANAYEGIFGTLMYAQSERFQGRIFPLNTSEERKLNDDLGIVTLYASKELIYETTKLYRHFGTLPPKTLGALKTDRAMDLRQIQDVAQIMRDELGIGPLFDPPSKESEGTPDTPKNWDGLGKFLTDFWFQK